MRLHRSLIALVAVAGLAQAPVAAQVVSPPGGSTATPQGAPPAATRPAPTPAAAAPAAAPASAPASAPARRARKTLEERFQAANTTHDGKLTLEQARAGRLVAVARDFAAIDKEKRGSVTLEQIKAHQAEARAANRARRAAAPAQ